MLTATELSQASSGEWERLPNGRTTLNFRRSTMTASATGGCVSTQYHSICKQHHSVCINHKHTRTSTEALLVVVVWSTSHTAYHSKHSTTKKLQLVSHWHTAAAIEQALLHQM
jgi:hypothetical protein